MDADSPAAREAEVKSLREKNEELRTKLREKSAHAAQAWARISALDSDKRAAEHEQALLRANNELLTQDIENLQRQLNGSAGWPSFFTSSTEQVERSSTGDAAHEAALALHQKEITDLQEALKESRRDLEKSIRENAEGVLQNSKAEEEIASLRDELTAQAPLVREHTELVQEAVERQKQSSLELLSDMERVLLQKVAAAEEATAAETKRADVLADRLKDYEDVAVEKADDVMAWLERPVGGGPLTPERPSHRRRASSGVCSEDGSLAADDASSEEFEMGDMTARLRMIFDYLHHGPGPDRPGRHAVAEMAEACVEEAEALELCRDRVVEKRSQMEAMRVSQLRRAPEHRSKSAEELVALSNAAFEEVMQFAQSAAESALADASTAGPSIEAIIWSLLADGADQRLVGNQYKQQLQDMMQAKLDQLDSDHRREVDAAEHGAMQQSRRSSSSESQSDPLRLSARDSFRGSGAAATLGRTTSGLLVSFLPGLTGDAAGNSVEQEGPTAGSASISEVMNEPNAHVGYLWKRGAVNRSWKKRWCELKAPKQGSGAVAGVLLYYTAVNDATPRGVINLAECSYEPGWTATNRKHTFKLVGQHRDGTKTAYLLAAGSVEEKQEWLEKMQ